MREKICTYNDLPQNAVYIAQVPGSSTTKARTSTDAPSSGRTRSVLSLYFSRTRKKPNGDDDFATQHPLVRLTTLRGSVGGVHRAGQAAIQLTKLSDQAIWKEDIHSKASRSDKAPKLED
jgi:hypothetical protein